MSANRIAVRYARALVEALVENKAVDQADSFLGFCEIVEGNKELAGVLANVTLRGEDKGKVVQALAEKLDLPTMVRNFLSVLASNGRLAILAKIGVAVSARLDEQRGVTSVALTTATEPTKEELAAFEAAMKSLLNKEVHINASTDPAILGGAVAQVGSFVYDGSVRAQLDRLRSDLIKEI